MNSRYPFTPVVSCLFIITIILFFSPHYVNAQSVNKTDAREIVEKLTAALIERYPFPEISIQYQNALLKNERDGKYLNLTEQRLAEQLTADLQQVHRDVHLHVLQNESQYKNLTSPAYAANNSGSELEQLQRQNYGFRNVDLDPLSSVAYINIPGGFYATQEAFDIAAAAMNMAAYSKYIIVDIRANGGGSGQMGRFLASYFYNAGDEQFYLNGFYKDRSRDEQEWTYAYVPGKRNPAAKVYILIGPGTGSAAEGFAYAMQKLHRATVVGEASAGAGIAGSFVPLKDNLIVFLPFKMVVGPNSQVGWEGTGVLPDSVTTGKDALAETRRFIWQDILNKSADSILKASVQWQLEDSKINPNDKIAKCYQEIAGKYDDTHLVVSHQGKLFWQIHEPGKPIREFEMLEVKPDVFTVIDLNKSYGTNSTRVYIQRKASGRLNKLTEKILLPNGSIYTDPRNFQQR
ncbi:S41 family peptidase [Mucilaginibacter jinjuensis]|uniref:S41 family peptidase n=1 Tax=Mucilaginibacter jinjuensis TaxID=1176721 RepID=A0ABY7TD36_9SPHI|nr:S41 family peptidase [Mucilaginibacter jinjuensis]WCT14371.1 S41 family peptidase [Mucilaginibacter jinjuensis]